MELKEIETQIEELEEQEEFSSPHLAKLIFKRAELTYKVSKIKDYPFNTQKIKEILDGIDELTDFNEELMVQIIKKIIIDKDGKIETEFINGLKVCETLENKRKEGVMAVQKKHVAIIPPQMKYDKQLRVEQKILRVAVYCRVSTLRREFRSSGRLLYR